MNVLLEPVHNVDILRIAVISQTQSGGHVLGRGVVFFGNKRPLAVLIKQMDVMSAYSVTGQRMSPDEVEGLCQGAVAAFETQER